MGYTYEQHKRTQERETTAPERTNAPGPGFSAPNPGASIPPAGPSFDLAGAMQARMASTFGDLSAVRNYTPLVQTHAPVQTGPYTGPVTHAVSGASSASEFFAEAFADVYRNGKSARPTSIQLVKLYEQEMKKYRGKK